MQHRSITSNSTESCFYVLQEKYSLVTPLTRKVFYKSYCVDIPIYLKCLISLVSSSIHNDNNLFQIAHKKSVKS